MAVKALSEAQKQNVVARIDRGEKRSSVANLYGVSTRTIGRILAEASANEIASDVVADHTQSIAVGEDTLDVGYIEPEPAAASFEYSVVLNSSSLTITKINIDTGDIAGDVIIDNGHPKFLDARTVIVQGNVSQESLAEAYEMLDEKYKIEKLTEGRVTVDVNGARVVYTTESGAEQSFPTQLSERIIHAARQGDEAINRLLKFADRLSNNPSNRAVKELYQFMVAMDLEIDEDGRVICWKAVRENFTDCHTGTFDNSVGKVVSVERNQVDEDSSQTCSYGLHVCSRAYLPSFARSNGRVIKVAVDPEDFVAIPQDYYSIDQGGVVKAKARVCKYEVLSDVSDEWNTYRSSL